MEQQFYVIKHLILLKIKNMMVYKYFDKETEAAAINSKNINS